MTEQEVNATLAKAAPASGGAGAPAASRSMSSPAAAPATTPAPRRLPKTGSAWPLLALASILSIAMGLTLTVRRRFVR